MQSATDHFLDRGFKAVYDSLFQPRSIVVIGASNNAFKPGGRVIKNIRDHLFQGDLWAVNPKTPKVLDLPTVKSINDLPFAPDLAIIAIPSQFVLSALEDLAAKETRAIIVLTSGFGEKDEQGKMVEQEMLRIAQSARMTLIGPNCSGFITKAYKGKFAGIIPSLQGAAVDFISGSGATVDYVMEYATTRGLSFGNVVNLGNSIHIGVEDILQLYDENYGPQSAKIVMLYLEAVKNPAKLLHHAQCLYQKGCRLVGIKSGATAAGERAAASHTGAIATSDTAVAALFDKAGIIRVDNRTSLVDAACVLAATKGRLSSNRACIITDAGGPGVMLSDELSRQGFELPTLKEQTRKELAKILPVESALDNPIDALPSRSASQIKEIIDVLGCYEEDAIDVIVVLLGDSGMSDNTPIYSEISLAMDNSPLPVVPMFSSIVTSRSKIEQFTAQNKVFFTDEVMLGRSLGLVAGTRKPENVTSDPDLYDRMAIRELLAGCSGVLKPDIAARILQLAGFQLPAQIEVFEKNRLPDSCRSLDFPLAMKVIGPLHKSDVGGVKLHLRTSEEVNTAWDELAQIPEFSGVMIQPMISGIEVILGASREDGFGHLVMFGLGGIYTEVFGDVTFSLAPLSLNESRNLIQKIRSYPLIEGARGQAGMSTDLLADYLQRLSWLVTDFPEINEIDLNPIKGEGGRLYAVDARIILR